MGKTFREWHPAQRLLLPRSVEEFVPAGDLAHFVRDLVPDSLDLSAITDAYREERGFPPCHPVMMTALLLYAYCQGTYSARRIAKACEQRGDFMSVTAMNRPDFPTISDFRKRHLAALGKLFVQVLRLCGRAELVKLGHVALDGTKLKANASRHKAMRYKWMKEGEARLAAEVASCLDQAEATEPPGGRCMGRRTPRVSARAPPGTGTAAMWRQLRRGGWRSRYRLRKQTVEAVFGLIKHARGC